jgi:hypothetical protein
VRAENDAVLAAGWRILAFALLALVTALVLGWTMFVPVALGAVGGWYGLQLAVDDAPLDLAAPLVAAGLVVTAELAYWSLEERERVDGEPGQTLRRLAYLLAVALGTFVVAGLLLTLVDGVRAGGLAIDLLGAAAAATVLAAVVLLTRPPAPDGG